MRPCRAVIRYHGGLMETVTLTIDGRPVTVEKGKTVLQAAIESGIKIPYYCYHPGLGIDGSCRVCIVKIEKMPKLQTSCSTPVADGMIVSTQTPDVVEARASVFEFLLINHPLDCPVCDKGGECPLQDFSYSFGPNESRMEFSRRVFDGEGVAGGRRLRSDADVEPQPLHPVYALRAVHARGRRRPADQHRRPRLWQRDRDVPGGGRALAAVGQPDGRLPGRGDHHARLPLQVAAVGQPGGGRHDLHAVREGLQHDRLDQGQAGVGQGRAAGADDAAAEPGRSTATGCATSAGSTITGSKATTACSSRCCAPRPARSSRPTGDRARQSWPSGSAAGGGGQRLRFLLSAHASLEELFVVGRLGGAFGVPEEGVAVSWRAARQAAAGRHEVQDSAGRRPQRAGRPRPRFPGRARRRPAMPTCRRSASDVQSGKVGALYVFDPGPAGSIGDLSWVIEARKSGALQTLIVHGVLMTDLANAADIVLPGAAWVEKDATYVNGQGRLQARVARSSRRPARRSKTGRCSCSVGVALGAAVGYASSAEIRAELAAAMSGNTAYEGVTTLSFARPVTAAPLAAGVEPVRALEVGLDVPGSAAGEVRRHAAHHWRPAPGHPAPPVDGCQMTCRCRVRVAMSAEYLNFKPSSRCT